MHIEIKLFDEKHKVKQFCKITWYAPKIHRSTVTMLVTMLWWWLYHGDRLKMTARIIMSVTNRSPSRSPISQISHQQISSPTSVTNRLSDFTCSSRYKNECNILRHGVHIKNYIHIIFWHFYRFHKINSRFVSGTEQWSWKSHRRF